MYVNYENDQSSLSCLRIIFVLSAYDLMRAPRRGDVCTGRAGPYRRRRCRAPIDHPSHSLCSLHLHCIQPIVFLSHTKPALATSTNQPAVFFFSQKISTGHQHRLAEHSDCRVACVHAALFVPCIYALVEGIDPRSYAHTGQAVRPSQLCDLHRPVAIAATR